MTMRLLTYLLCLLLQACGNGDPLSHTASTSQPQLPPNLIKQPQNAVAVVVDSGPLVSGQSVNAVNMPYVSITLCVPGSTTQCQTIEHILVDTGSSGLRILSSALASDMPLPPLKNSDGNPVAECAVFADGYSWGSVKQADLRIAGEVAKNLSLQIIGDNMFSSIPSACSRVLNPQNSVKSFQANGVLGIASFIQDCGVTCADQSVEGWYYTCTERNCRAITLPLSKQVGNPVALFQKNNNGTLLQLPEISATGATSVTGFLIFGIDTQPNNALGNANIYTLDSNANLHTLYQEKILKGSFDSGSNALFFDDPTIATCGNTGGSLSIYCPSSMQNRSAMNTGLNGFSNIIIFNVAKANNIALNNRAGIAASHGLFYWGLPFFFGRSVFTAIEGAKAAGTIGPYIAY